MISPVTRPPILVPAALVVAALAWASSLVFGDGPLSPSSAALLGGDLLILATVVAVGTVLAGGAWTGRAAAGLTVAMASLAFCQPIDGRWVAAVLATFFSAVGIVGNRRRSRNPGAELPVRAIVLVLGLLALPGVVAACAPGGIAPSGWLLAAFAAVSAWGYGRASVPFVWALRLLLPLLGGAAASASGWRGGIVLAAAAALTGLAWTREAMAAAVGPAIRRTAPVPIPPELTPQEVLHAAGYDERGRRKAGR